jgi:hypothetical protein
MILSTTKLNQVLQVEKQKDKQMKDLAKQETKAVAIPEAFKGFSDEEVLGGMDPIQEGYLKSFRYFLSRPTLKDKFQIVDNTTDEVVWEGNRIEKAVIYYGHEIMRLKSGYITSPKKSDNEFDDEEKKILAVTYDSAKNAKGEYKSRGSFDSNGYSEYLTNLHKDIHGKMTRLYLVMIIPSIKNLNLEPVAASFSVTTVSSFKEHVKNKKIYNVPLPYLYSNIFFEEDKAKNGTVYDRIVFDFPMKDGFPLSVFENREAYLNSKRGVTLLNEIQDTHKAATEYSENSGGSGSIVVEEEGIPSYSDLAAESKSTFTDVDHLADTVKSQFKGTEVDPNSDEMPF